MSFISWAWKGIKNADYFGLHINFRYANRPKYRSVFGGIVFITYFLHIFDLIYLAEFSKFCKLDNHVFSFQRRIPGKVPRNKF